MTKITNSSTVKSWPEKVGRLQLVSHDAKANHGYSESWAVYCEAPTARTIDVSMQAQCYGGSYPDCDCEDCYPGGYDGDTECEHTLGRIGERCVAANEMFTVHMPWQYYLLRAVPGTGGFNNKTGEYDMTMCISLDRIVWSLFGPDQPERMMIWCPLLNLGSGNGICAPTYSNTPNLDIPEQTVAEVFDKLLMSNWNTDNGYVPSAFYNWMFGSERGMESHFEDMMSFYGKWQALSEDDVFRAPHSSAGWTLETWLKDPRSTYITQPREAAILWVEEGGEVKSTKKSVDLPSRIRYY